MSNYNNLLDSHLDKMMRTPTDKAYNHLSEEQKIAQIEQKVSEIMQILGLDLSDDSLSDTPKRVAKMYVKEVFSGLNPSKRPSSSTFENKYQYGEMLIEKNITVYSTCEHHLLPIVGVAHVAYISTGNVIGLSKMNRIVDYYAKRPQVQERMTIQIVRELQDALNSEDVACMVDAKDLCVNSRAISDINSSTITSEYGGVFKRPEIKKEFIDYLKLNSNL